MSELMLASLCTTSQWLPLSTLPWLFICSIFCPCVPDFTTLLSDFSRLSLCVFPSASNSLLEVFGLAVISDLSAPSSFFLAAASLVPTPENLFWPCGPGIGWGGIGLCCLSPGFEGVLGFFTVLEVAMALDDLLTVTAAESLTDLFISPRPLPNASCLAWTLLSLLVAGLLFSPSSPSESPSSSSSLPSSLAAEPWESGWKILRGDFLKLYTVVSDE